MKTITLDGRDVYVRATRSGDVQFRYPDDTAWFWVDGTERNARLILSRLSPTALRTIADAKESSHV